MRLATVGAGVAMQDRRPLKSFKMAAGLSYFGLCAAGFLVIAFLTSKAHSITCYKCNSQFDPNCADPFNAYTIGSVNCSLLPIPEHIEKTEATLCRKVSQKIEGKIRVIRDCGYITDADRDNKACTKRSGTHEVNILYCSCTSDLCNQATVLDLLLPLLSLPFISFLL